MLIATFSNRPIIEVDLIAIGFAPTNPVFSIIADLANKNLKDAVDIFAADLENALGGGHEIIAKKNQSEAEVIALLERIGMEVDIHIPLRFNDVTDCPVGGCLPLPGILL